MKKFISLTIAVILVLSCFGVAFANEATSTIVTKADVYEKIKDDYMFITDTTDADADELFSIIETTGITQEIREYVGDILPETLKTSEDIVLYIQNDYAEIVSNLTTSEKEMIDLFFLENATIYYISNPTAYNSLKEIYELEELFKTTISQSSLQSRGPAVCKLTIFSDIGGDALGNSGHGSGLGKHAWLRFENLSSSAIMVGGLSVPAGQAVTIGTTGAEDEHRGAWYNLEYKRINNYRNCYSKSVNIDSTTLYNITLLLKARDTWEPAVNCATYASIMWNQSGGTTLNAGVIPTPNSLANAIIGTGSYNVNEQFTAISTVYYNATTPTVSTEHN